MLKRMTRRSAGRSGRHLPQNWDHARSARLQQAVALRQAQAQFAARQAALTQAIAQRGQVSVLDQQIEVLRGERAGVCGGDGLLGNHAGAEGAVARLSGWFPRRCRDVFRRFAARLADEAAITGVTGSESGRRSGENADVGMAAASAANCSDWAMDQIRRLSSSAAVPGREHLPGLLCQRTEASGHRDIALSLPSGAKGTISLGRTGKKAGWPVEFLEQVIRRPDPHSP